VPDTQLRGAGGALSRFVGSNQQDRFLRVTPIHRVAGVWGRLQKLPHRFQRVKRGVPAGRCVTMTEIVEAGSTVPAAGATGGGSFGSRVLAPRRVAPGRRRLRLPRRRPGPNGGAGVALVRRAFRVVSPASRRTW
jgi:hypothetical protein